MLSTTIRALCLRARDVAPVVLAALLVIGAVAWLVTAPPVALIAVAVATLVTTLSFSISGLAGGTGETNVRRIEIESDGLRLREAAPILMPGCLIVSAPPRMRVGSHARLRVVIASGQDVAERAQKEEIERAAVGIDQAEVTVESLLTALLMKLQCFYVSDGIEIRSLTPATQRLINDTAKWEFDLYALDSGVQSVVLTVSALIPNPYPDGREFHAHSLEVKTLKIEVTVSALHAAREVWMKHWVKVVVAIIGLGGGLSGWLKVLGLGS